MKPAAYYNEIDPFAAQWLRNLIAGGHIAPGEVDERSIEDVTPDDLRGFTQCHFFAGIGVWSHSLRLAGWPDNKPVWTGSCPCQPFSAAGKGDGFADERHLWPHFFHLISECTPQHVFGEQVASGNANAWFDLVQSDLEGMGYAFGLVPFAAAGVGAPHIRERAYWVANTEGKGFPHGRSGAAQSFFTETDGKAFSTRPLEVNGFWRDADWLLCRDGKWRPVEPGTSPLVDGAAARLGRVEPGVARVASSNRVGRLKGYGNAINAQAAAEFIRAYMGVSYGR
ncbi:DNA cytosine methyltransferase [Enterobacter ludwigii]|uniref:DNA cytosine methyltransferase n=1 Tax=Enterobacter ludwigii TaxID=299767 RepID=UPI0020533A57|nr:DNA cytosine methyltransferase [Enterobacter ludwigii]DAQ32967.1 MAG TPA: Cytosine specific methyltransferase [Caudoviricetes sp.]